MTNNYRTESLKFFNAKTGKNKSAWNDAAAAYFRQLGTSNKRSLPEAMAAYYAKINAGTIAAPVQLATNQAVITNAGLSPVQNSAGTAIANGTYTVTANTVGNIKLPSTVGAVSNGTAPTITVTTTTARTAGQSDSKVVTFTVANGVITSITI
ncbi:hypothetical protein [Pantoea piersonii]|uniref:hypothetical protein n=1 Tax=Pantoea piersonii TaxID=2364647 RepID=UPI0028B1E202|nr:hypothetical protein [Pantoea piersonii]